MTRQATYQSGEEPLPGDLVRRTGESVGGAFQVIQGHDYTVHRALGGGWIELEGVHGEWPARSFSLVQRTEGKS